MKNYDKTIEYIYEYIYIYIYIYISYLKDCNWTRTHNHLVCKPTLNHLSKWLKWLNG